VADGTDMVARGQMQVAALLAGWAFSNALLGLVHAMAHSLGAVCRLPHGLANGILLPHVMQFNIEEVPDLLADIASAMGVNTHGMAEQEAAASAVKEMEGLIARIGLPTGLREAGVDEACLAECAELAMSDGSIVYNPRMVMEAEEVLAVYRGAL
jgi:alcohol dehydrogenase